jgi:hypothetical protein
MSAAAPVGGRRAALAFIFAIRRYLFTLWGIANR